MKPALHSLRGSRHALVAALVTVLVILAPVCRALCVDPGSVDPGSPAAPAATTGTSVADCHGMTSEADEPDASSACCGDEDQRTTQDRHQPAPSALIAVLAPIAPGLSGRVAVAFRHRLDPALLAQGPPLRLLTLRFIE